MDIPLLIVGISHVPVSSLWLSLHYRYHWWYHSVWRSCHQQLFIKQFRSLGYIFFTHLCIVRNNPSNIFYIPQQLCGMPLAILWRWIEWRDIPDNKIHGANMGPTGDRQDPGGPHVGPMNYIIWDSPLVFIILIKNCWWNRLLANHPLGGLHIKQCLKDFIT